MRKVSFVLAIMLIALVGCQLSPSSTRDISSYTTYSDSDVGINFRYPAFLTPKTETTKDRGSGGGLIEMTRILLESTDPVYAIYVDVVEGPDPPWNYPPDGDLLRMYVAMDLGELDTEKTEANSVAAMTAVKSAVITKISGFPAAVYQVTFDDTPVGRVYIRGAVVLSSKRSFTLFHVGSIEPDAPSIVTKEFVDNTWSEFVNSISLARP
jgi:hypothetical protein